jgi:hypothetical protein
MQRRSLPRFLASSSIFVAGAFGLAACGGAERAGGPGAAAPVAGVASAAPSASGSTGTAKPAPLPIALPQLAEAPSMCAEYATKPLPTDADKSLGTCPNAAAALAALGEASIAESKRDRAARELALAKLARCERLPPLVLDVWRAETAPLACAEAILKEPITAHGSEAMPAHLAAAKGLVAASRLARLRPKKGDFDLLVRAEVDPAAREAGIKSVQAWKDALDHEEAEAAALAKGAPAEVQAVVVFEVASAWIALVQELRATPYPEELRALHKDHDVAIDYYAELDKVTAPPLDHARMSAQVGLGLGARDGVLLSSLPSFAPIAETFKSRSGFERRPTRELDLDPPKLDLESKTTRDSARIAAALPPWAAFALLERLAPAELLEAPVLSAFAWNRGIPAVLRREVEKEAKLDPTRKALIGAARLRVAIEYAQRSDAEVASLAPTPTPADALRAALAKALLGPSATPKKAKLPAEMKADDTPRFGFDLSLLDAFAKSHPALAHLAMFDAAVLALEAAQRFGGGDEVDTFAPRPDPKVAYETAIARLDAVAASKDKNAIHAARARELADSARASVKLLGAAGAKPAGKPASAPTLDTKPR